MTFARQIIEWNKNTPNKWPWQGEKNPWFILLSEFLLQQTRSDQALLYYEEFITRFPSPKALAETSEDDLLRAWQGLGYYSRARNLHKTAKVIVEHHAGNVPDSYSELLKLPGIGPYTAAAISSFAFGKRHAVVDGNVYRVLSRYGAIATPIDSTAGKKEFQSLAFDLLGNSDPAAFNQAIMNLGANLCTPKSPDCASCPLNAQCVCAEDETYAQFPVKSKRRPLKHRCFHYLEIYSGEQTLLQKRQGKDIWQGLYQFPLIETTLNSAIDSVEIDSELEQLNLGKRLTPIHVSDLYSQTLSHQQIHARFYNLEVEHLGSSKNDSLTLVFRKNLENFALPRIIRWYLNPSDE